MSQRTAKAARAVRAVRRPQRLSYVERRAQIIDAATQLFSRFGFSGTTTREIARAARINVALIFRFFPRKDDLYAAIIDKKAELSNPEVWLDELRGAAAARDDVAVVGQFLRRIIYQQRHDPDFVRLMLYSGLEEHSVAARYRERYFAPLYTFLLEYVELRQREGRFRAGDPRILVRTMIAVAWYQATAEIMVPTSEFPLLNDEDFDTYTHILLDGLQTRCAAPSMDGGDPG
jgi:TetR/AcrR family transcriptional regulator